MAERQAPVRLSYRTPKIFDVTVLVDGERFPYTVHARNKPEAVYLACMAHGLHEGEPQPDQRVDVEV